LPCTSKNLYFGGVGGSSRVLMLRKDGEAVGLEKDVAVVLLAEVGPDVVFARVYELPELRCEAPVFDDLCAIEPVLAVGSAVTRRMARRGMRGHETRWGVAWVDAGPREPLPGMGCRAVACWMRMGASRGWGRCR